MKRYRLPLLALAALVAALAVAAAAATGGSAPAKKTGGETTLSIIGIWTGREEQSFQAVIAGFERKNPNLNVRYTSAGDNTPQVLSTAVQGGNPPDLAAVAQPGLVRDFARRNSLKPITFARPTIARNFSSGLLRLATINGRLYGLVFKGANKSTVWYSTRAFRNAGVRPPATFDQLLNVARTLRASGVRAYSIGGADGWTLTDLFENIYLRQAGPANYDRLAAHRIKWTHPTVKATLRTMAAILGDTRNLLGNTNGALQTDFPTSVNAVISPRPRAAMVIEGDFVPGVATTRARAIRDYNVFTFPSVNRSRPSVVGGGDTIVMFKDSPGARALVSYLATAEAATIWARRGGFSSPNRNVKPSAYSDPLTRKTATALARATTFRFDLSDLQPSAFGGTVGQGLFKLFQDFLRNPRNVNGIAAKMEAAAAKAYRG